MATTDQLRKAERKSTLPINSYRRSHYIAALEAAGQTGVRSLSKVDLWKRIVATGITMKPDWHKSSSDEAR